MSEDGAFSAEQVAGLLGLTLAQIRGYVRAGVIEPERGPRGELRFSFQDLVFLRVVKGLATARIPPRRVRMAIRRLRQQLPDGRPLSGLRLAAQGGQVVVRERDRVWSPDSGQYWLDFERPEPGPGGAVSLPDRDQRASPDRDQRASPDRDQRASPDRDQRASPAVARTAGGEEPPVELTATAQGWYSLGCEIEESDPAQAREAYLRALELEPGHADARVNLGCLEHEAGRLEEAIGHYRAALASRPQDATAAFDLGVALEDLGSFAEARGAYEQALASEPDCADAHYNLARLHDRLGDRAGAIRHLRAYRQLLQH